MSLPPTIIPASRRVPRRRRGRGASAPTPPAALTLVAAMYSEGAFVQLTFDRAIDIDAIDASQIVVDDDEFTGNRYGGTTDAALINPATVQVGLDRIDSSSESGVHLIASASSGIVASDDGGTWAGVANLVLPFP